MSDASKPPTSHAAPEPRPKSPTDRAALPPASTIDPRLGPRAELAKAIPRRPRVSWWLGLALAALFAVLVMPAITAERWLDVLSAVERGTDAPFTVRVPPFSGYETASGNISGAGVLIARGEEATRDHAEAAAEIEASLPHGAVPYLAYILLVGALGALFTHHMRRSTYGRLLRVQLVSLSLIIVAAVVVKLVMLATPLSVLVIPVAVFAMVPTLVLDRIVGLATGTLAALVFSLLVPFDVGVAILLMVPAGVAGLVIAERPKKSLRALLLGGLTATVITAATYPLMLYLTAGRLPIDELRNPLHSAWLAAALGPAIATVLAIVFVPLYQLLVGEITHGKLVELEDMSHPLLRQISERSPGTWQHSLTMANMAEIAANAIGANGRLVRVGAYFHDLGKSLTPKYFIENLEPGETSPHDKLPPETSCDAIFAHVTEGIVTARKAGLHERIIDFMHMHHGNGVLEYFWAKCKEQQNPKGLSVEHFRYPGVPPQSRETAILSICDAVEAAARTLKKPEVSAIDNLVQRIVYGKLHLGQLDESGLSMGDLRRVAESLRETIRHANHNRIEYPWQKAAQDASASADREKLTQTGPRLDSLDRPARPESVATPTPRPNRISEDALAKTDNAGATPKLRPNPQDSAELANLATAPVVKIEIEPAASSSTELTGKLKTDTDVTKPAPKLESHEVEIVELIAKAKAGDVAVTQPPIPNQAHETDPRMLRVTNPVEPQRPASEEVVKFAAEAKEALAEASKDLATKDLAAKDGGALPREVLEAVVDHDAPRQARKRAATLPPIKPPTVPPPLGRRSPTLPPLPGTMPVPQAGTRPPPLPGIPNVTVPPSDVLRPPAPPSQPPPSQSEPELEITIEPSASTSSAAMTNTVPPSNVVRPPGPNLLEDMVTLKPQYELRPELKDETQPDLELPSASGSWTAGLAARLDKQLEADFGTETPIIPPTRAELQALLNVPPDVTREQSLDELELLQRAARERSSEPDLELTRRVPYPTTEVDEADIEAAIELAPPARRNAIGIAKKKPSE